MSSQRGNVKRTRGQKHQNKSAFKNTLHDKSKKTQMIVSTEVSGICARCKDIIDWKIKYKLYKPLTVPKKCTVCQQKTVKKAYYIMCDACASEKKLCAKCGKNKDIVQEPGLSASEEAAQQGQLQQELKLLPERKRRTFLRLQASGKFGEEEGASGGNTKEEDNDNDNEKDNDSYEDESSGYEDEDCEFDSEPSVKDEEAAMTTLKLIESRKQPLVLKEMDSTTEAESDSQKGAPTPSLVVGKLAPSPGSAYVSSQAGEGRFTETDTSSDNIIV